MGLNSFYLIIQLILLLAAVAILQLLKHIVKSGVIVGRLQIILLLVYSYYYICSVDWRFALCVVTDTLIAYCCGLLIFKSKRNGNDKKAQKITIWGGIALVLILVYFKYTNFFIESFNAFFGCAVGTLNIILPLGISFFTFSALSYVIDVYRESCDAERNIIDFALYVVFFTKIMAGPIVRWTEFKPQIKNYRGVNLKTLNDGIQIFVFGLFKKMVLADHLGVFVDDVFQIPSAFNTGTVILSAISYSLQIYLDFSGYSDMAIGLSKIMGFDFSPNFNLPYIARGFSDFWNRWHISLSKWFRDYLYIPLGGSRRGEVRTYINLLVVMLVSGVWHGAGWTFILWGILHGLGSCITRLIKKHQNNNSKQKFVIKAIEVFATFFFVTLFWTIFRADGMREWLAYSKALFTIHGGINQPYSWSFVTIVFVIVVTIIAIMRSKKMNQSRTDGFYPIMNLTKVWSLIMFFTICGLTILLGYYGNTAFIYGGF